MKTDGARIGAEQLERSAFVYVRQSSLGQVRNNHESRRRQYAFAEEASALGFPVSEWWWWTRIRAGAARRRMLARVSPGSWRRWRAGTSGW